MTFTPSKNGLIIPSPAKINLCLDVLEHCPSGYHKIQTVFHQTNQIEDFVTIQATSKTDSLSMVQGGQKQLLKNTIHPAQKALQITKKLLNTEQKISIKIQQNIPFSSGLGGSSSNAAAVIKGLNKLWNLNLTTAEMLKIAEKVGMDVPFFIIGGTAIGSNYGEKITPLPALKGLKFTIQPQSSPLKDKTRQAYSTLNLVKCGQQTAKTTALIEAIKTNNPQEIIANLHNDFAPANLAKNHHLSGSGPSTFTAFLPLSSS